MVISEENKKRGKRNRMSGAAFELRVRKDLEEKGWVCDKWSNNVSDFPESNINLPSEEREDRKLVPAKHKFRGPGIPMAMGTGFPDFACSKAMGQTLYVGCYEFIGVECKTQGYLDKVEKEKCKWLLENNVFSQILIAFRTKVKNRVIVKYKDFQEYNHGR